MQQASLAQSQRATDPASKVCEVACGSWKITMPITFPLRTVNVHVLVGNDGWALVDTGIGTADARAAFWEGLQQLGLGTDTLQAIVLSHQHPDHIGLSGELHEQSNAKVYMHPLDEAHVHRISTGTMPEHFKHVSHFLKQHGLPPKERRLHRQG